MNLLRHARMQNKEENKQIKDDEKVSKTGKSCIMFRNFFNEKGDIYDFFTRHYKYNDDGL